MMMGNLTKFHLWYIDLHIEMKYVLLVVCYLLDVLIDKHILTKTVER